jgi:hypothetical protein
MFISLIELYSYMQQIGGRMLFPLHDSIMFELPISVWKEAVLKIVEVMEDVPRRLFGDTLPFAADCDVGWRWGRMIEFKKDADGVLRVDKDVPKWWIEDTYQANVSLDAFELTPEPEHWAETLVWEEMPWEN